MRVSLEHSIVERSAVGVSEHDTPGGWRAICAKRRDGRFHVSYHHAGDHPRYVEALRARAEAFAAARDET